MPTSEKAKAAVIFQLQPELTLRSMDMNYETFASAVPTNW